MRFMLKLSVATLGISTLAFAVAAPAAAQETYTHTHYAHAHYRRHTHYGETRQIIVRPQQPAEARTFVFGPVAAVGSVVGGTGQAVQAVFTGAGGVVGGVVGGVLGGVSALFGGPGYTSAPASGYGGPFAAPFNAAGTVAVAPFQVVSGAFGGMGAPAYTY